MNIIELMEDSLRYPLSNWKKIIVLGIITLFTSISGITMISTLFGTTDITITRFLDIFYLLVYGYLFRIMKSSAMGETGLPEFNNWLEMFKDGIKVFIVAIVYSMPAILIILAFAAVPFVSNLGIIGSNISTVISTLWGTAGILALIPVLYMIIIIPVTLVAVMNMAYNNSELKAAFRFDEIMNMILIVGRKYFIGWYIISGIIYLVLFLLGSIIFTLFSVLIHPIFQQTFSTLIIVQIFTLLILTPYLNMYFARSLSLFYMLE